MSGLLNQKNVQILGGIEPGLPFRKNNHQGSYDFDNAYARELQKLEPNNAESCVILKKCIFGCNRHLMPKIH